MRVLIEDGPHQGMREVSEVTPELMFIDPMSTPLSLSKDEKDETLPIGPRATYQRYLLLPEVPGDFQRGIDARYRWEP